MLDLLEDRVDEAVLERVAAEDEQREAVGVRGGGCRDHVRRAGTDRRRGDHDLAAALRLCIGNGGQRHRLLVVAAPGRQDVLNRVQRLGERHDVAMAEDAERTAEQRHFVAVDDRSLGDEVL